ncbi:MAG: hypothetical protein J6V55_06390 [Alistipes sp.]|nr:hypothetical protein [Alistipes sp.]
MEQRFIKIRSTKDIIIFTAFIIAGILLVVLPKNIGANMGGYTLIVIGIILSQILKSDYCDKQTLKRYYKHQLYFDATQKSLLQSAVASTPNTIDTTSEGAGQTLRLDIYFSRQANRASLQLFEYVPHEYCPCTEVYNYDLTDIKPLINK